MIGNNDCHKGNRNSYLRMSGKNEKVDRGYKRLWDKIDLKITI